jgi:hypothetical protein
MNSYIEIYSENDKKVKLSRWIYAYGFYEKLFCIFVILYKFIRIFEVGANF